MSCTIQPPEQLVFNGPFTRANDQSLMVKNGSTEPILYKIKTTAPKQYCVRPNAGRIEANSEAEIKIILQAFKEELPEDYKCKDKFLVQTAPIIRTDINSQDITTLWSRIETEAKETMKQHKIKCVFYPLPNEEENSDSVATDNQATAAANTKSITALPISAIDNNSSHLEEQTAPSVPSHGSHIEPLTFNNALSDQTVTATSPIVQSTHNPAFTTATTNNDIKTHVTSAPALAPVPISRDILPRQTNTTIPAPKNDENEQKLKQALEKVALLEKQLAEIQSNEGIRPRLNTSVTGSSRKLAPTVQPLDAVHQHLAALEKPRSTEGYPPQVVLGIALFTFIFTWLFF